MRIMGVDPGLAVTGYGIIDGTKGDPHLVAFGTFETQQSMGLPGRLVEIHHQLEGVARCYHPDVLSCESLFYGRNIKNVILMSHARGIVLMVGHQSGMEIAEYTPREIKQAVAGTGRASKQQVAYMVRSLLSIDDRELSEHASDALAAALCHQFRAKGKGYS